MRHSSSIHHVGQSAAHPTEIRVHAGTLGHQRSTRCEVVIPKSVKPARIEENNLPADQAPISEADMATLDGFDEYLVTGWDPTKKP